MWGNCKQMVTVKGPSNFWVDCISFGNLNIEGCAVSVNKYEIIHGEMLTVVVFASRLVLVKLSFASRLVLARFVFTSIFSISMICIHFLISICIRF